MIIGNIQAQEAIAHYFSIIQASGEIAFPFLLLSGPKHIGKTSIVEKYIQDLVTDYVQNDYLALYDQSYTLGKKHSLKIEVPMKDQFVKGDNGDYIDMGSRDVVQWLSMAPTGNYKVVFLENIERMTIGAANAFLKTREEPLPKRIIVATTSNKELLLDTILSRAFIVQFQLPPAEEVTAYLAKRYPEKSDAQRLFASSFSLGRIGLAIRLLEDMEDTESVTLFQQLIDLFKQPGSREVTKKFSLLQSLATQTSEEQVVDAVLYATMHASLPTEKWMRARKMMKTNVSDQNILFSLAIS